MELYWKTNDVHNHSLSAIIAKSDGSITSLVKFEIISTISHPFGVSLTVSSALYHEGFNSEISEIIHKSYHSDIDSAKIKAQEVATDIGLENALPFPYSIINDSVKKFYNDDKIIEWEIIENDDIYQKYKCNTMYCVLYIYYNTSTNISDLYESVLDPETLNEKFNLIKDNFETIQSAKDFATSYNIIKVEQSRENYIKFLYDTYMNFCKLNDNDKDRLFNNNNINRRKFISANEFIINKSNHNRI